jgi:hypothetical protein
MAALNHLGNWPSSSCWSSPTHATWPSGRSSAPGTSSSSLTSTTWSTHLDAEFGGVFGQQAIGNGLRDPGQSRQIELARPGNG